MQEAAEEEQLQQQRAEFFSRADDSGAWQSIGQGTVMWMPHEDKQRLMVVEEEPPSKSLGSVVLPSEPRPRALPKLSPALSLLPTTPTL